MDNKEVHLNFILTSICQAWHGRLFKDTNFPCSLEAGANDPSKAFVGQAANNPINFFLINANIISHYL